MSSEAGGDKISDDSASASTEQIVRGDVVEAAARRRVLASVATELTESRIAELSELKEIVGKLGVAVSRLNDVRVTIESVNHLHAVLEAKLYGDLHAPSGLRGETSANESEQPARVEHRSFSTCLDEIIAMLLE